MRYQPATLSHKRRKQLKKWADKFPPPAPRIKPGSLGWMQGPLQKINSAKK